MDEKKTITNDSFSHAGKDFIVKPPGWITRYGIGISALFFFILLILAAVIRYPDKIEAPATITSNQPPVRLTAPQDGNLALLNVTSEQSVQPGALLAVFQHEGAYKKILQLDSLTGLWESQISTLPENLPQLTRLGLLTLPYQQFQQAYEQFLHEVSKDYATQKIRNLQQQIDDLHSINDGLRRQMVWRDKTVEITRSQVHRDSMLFQEGSVSAIDYENSRKRLYNLIESRENQNAQLLENKLKISALNGQIIDVHEKKSDYLLAKEQDLSSSLQALRNKINDWKKNHLLLAPQEGTVQVSSDIIANQYFPKGKEILALVPKQISDGNKGVALLPFRASGKVDAKATIQLKLDGFPYKEYGLLKTKVDRIAAVSVQGKGYEVHFNLPDTLITTYGKQIPLKQEMRGIAEIITKKESILSRIFRELTYLLNSETN
jgi:multidrug efflux pump subunit AcrA (membrane-fusion protein)